jgi:cytochrome bd ubiquinol oxidase subunit II
MELQILWFVLIAVLWTGFFFLEGFDFGVGMLAPLLGREDRERRAVINTIGPHWDGNEVWLLTAGGAMFAAFPNWYATLFSAMYLPFTLLLLALIVRGVTFEFRSRLESSSWRRLWDWALFGGSLVPALLVGVAMTDLLLGIPIDANGAYIGRFGDLVRPLALLGGLLGLVVFLSHGALFLSLKLEGDLEESLRRYTGPLALAALGIFTLFAACMLAFAPALRTQPWWFYAVGLLAWLGLGSALVLQKKQRMGLAFASTGIAIAATTAALFIALFPCVMISSLAPEYSLTLQNAASTPYTLRLMSIVAIFFVPMVLGYQIWSYWVFRKRISPRDKLVY